MPQKPNKSTVARLLEQADKRKEQAELTAKEYQELKRACRGVFTTRNGKLLGKYMMKISGLYRLNKEKTNPYVMGEERGREFMYLFFVKGQLSPDHIQHIETGD